MEGAKRISNTVLNALGLDFRKVTREQVALRELLQQAHQGSCLSRCCGAQDDPPGGSGRAAEFFLQLCIQLADVCIQSLARLGRVSEGVELLFDLGVVVRQDELAGLLGGLAQVLLQLLLGQTELLVPLQQVVDWWRDVVGCRGVSGSRQM